MPQPSVAGLETPAARSFADRVAQYFRDFQVLKETRTEYWGIQLINLIDSTIYFALLNIASVFLSQNVGLSDEEAGYSVALFTTATTIFLFFSGTVTDWLGIRVSIHAAMIGQGILRLLVAVVGLMPSFPHRGLAATVLLFLMAPFMAMVQTVFQSANRRYTTETSRSAGFSLWYLAMNIGAAAGGFLIDIDRLWLKWSNAHIFTIGAVAALACSAITFLLIRDERQLDLGAPRTSPSGGEAAAAPGKAAKKNPVQIALEVVREPTLWRLVVLIALILGARAVFAYLYLLMPKYWLRTIGAEARMGTLQAINPILIVFGIILFIPLVGRFRLFSMLVYGAMISAASLLFLAVPYRLLSADIAYAHYSMSVLCMIALSIGEVVWSPKLYEYTAAIAPEGQEGTYLGISLVPWFLAKTLVSVLSGHLLVRFCPEGIGPRIANGEVGYWNGPAAMWLLLSLVGLLGCFGALLLRGWLTRGLKER
ncbi:MAG TPA: MFS transporter [Anaeromyxobacter sp.]|nr:MFS transporter [Anaeromyxobacter sp.]